MQVDIKIVKKILYLAEICLAELENVLELIHFELIHQFLEQSTDVVVAAAAYSERLKSGLGFLGI